MGVLPMQNSGPGERRGRPAIHHPLEELGPTWPWLHSTVKPTTTVPKSGAALTCYGTFLWLVAIENVTQQSGAG